MGTGPIIDSLVFEKSSSGTYFTLFQVAVMQLQFPQIKAHLACLSLAEFLVLCKYHVKKQPKISRMISFNGAVESFFLKGAVSGSCPH